MNTKDLYEEGQLFYAKIKTLKEVKNENWEIYYIDEQTGEKWKREYPESWQHGGGSAILHKIDKFPWE